MQCALQTVNYCKYLGCCIRRDLDRGEPVFLTSLLGKNDPSHGRDSGAEFLPASDSGSVARQEKRPTDARKPGTGRAFVSCLSATYSFSKNSQPEQEMYTPPGMPRSRSLTRFTMRVGLPHFGQSVDFDVSIAFLRSPVFAILAMDPDFSPQKICLGTHAHRARLQRCGHRSFVIASGAVSSSAHHTLCLGELHCRKERALPPVYTNYL